MSTSTRAAVRFFMVLTLVLSSLGAVAQTSPFGFIEVTDPTLDATKTGNAVSALPRPAGKKIGPANLTDPSVTQEVEPNNTFGTATPLTGITGRIQGNIFAAADIDFYSITALAGDRIYAATQTLFDASASGDSTLQVLNTDGVSILETDNNDGTFNASSSTIAGLVLPANGTYFIRVAHNLAANTIRPYRLYYSLETGAPTAETEPNETTATATPMPGSGWVSGTITAVSPTEQDFYSINLNAGDSVYLSLDMNPERDVNVWNGRLGFALFGNAANQILLANDANAGAAPADPNSEAFFFTVLNAGTYFVYVDSIVAAGLGVNATYQLSASVFPHVPATGNCTTYTSLNVPQVIPTGPGSVSSTLTIPGNPRIADLDVSIDLNHTFMADLDVHLISPAGNDNGLFTDIGAATVGGPQTQMTIRFDDEAAIPPAFALSTPFVLQPELAFRLGWFDGEDAGGVWTLQIRDDATGDGGTLNSWSLTVCEPAPAPACPAGHLLTTVFITDFESGAAGFTHSGTADEWELGLPTFAPITTCASGVNCFKTDLDNTYDISSNQDLVSPGINLTGLVAPVTVNWSQRYHIESATFDHASVDIENFGGGGASRLFEFLDATMNNTVGNPAATINESSGWSRVSARADSYAGLNTQLRFHLDSDNTVNLAGLAIDDVSVTACLPLANPTLITVASAPVVIGGNVSDDGTLAGGSSPTGSITFNLYGPNDATCTGAIAFTANIPVAGNGVYNSGNFAPTSAGTYRWTASYSGDGLNNPATSACNAPNESVVVSPASPTLTTQASAGVTIGGNVNDDGTLAGGASPTGSITFDLYGPNDATCAGAIAFTANIPVAGNGVYNSGNFAPATAGTYRWVANYSGDTNNNAASSPCNAPNESVVVSQATPTLSTQASAPVTLGGNVNDDGTLAAGVSPTGSITFDLYGPNDATCTGAIAFTATIPVSGNAVYNSGNFTPTLAGTYRWVAAYTGDANNVAVTSPCNSPNESVAVGVVTPTLITQASAGVNLGGNVNDDATLAGGASPTGSITFDLYGPNDATCAGAVAFTANIPVAGNGVYNSGNFAPAAAGTYRWVANYSGDANNAAANSPCNAPNESVVVTALGANVGGTKTAPPGPYTVGSNVTYTIVLTNSGPGPQGDNPGNEFIDVLPAQLQLVSANSTSGTAVATIGTNTVTWNGALASAGSVTITITATILPAAAGTTVNNQGTINYDSDGNGTNDATAQTDDPAVGGAGNPTGIVVAPATGTEIPLLSPLALLMLTALLAAVALMKFRTT